VFSPAVNLRNAHSKHAFRHDEVFLYDGIVSICQYVH